MGELALTRLVTIKECPWLERDFEQGEVVFEYTDHTYGCVSLDGVACTEVRGRTPFFELPRDALARKAKEMQS